MKKKKKAVSSKRSKRIVVKRGKAKKKSRAKNRQDFLMKAIEAQDLQRVRDLLRQVNPDFIDPISEASPLMMAAMADDLDITKAIVNANADINFVSKTFGTALDAADYANAAKTTNYLMSIGGARVTTTGPGKKITLPKKNKTQAVITEEDIDEDFFTMGAGKDLADQSAAPEPKFTEQNLKDIFNPASWTGKLGQMKQLWREVPDKLKKKFDFAAALAAAQRDTINKKYPAPPALGN